MFCGLLEKTVFGIKIFMDMLPSVHMHNYICSWLIFKEKFCGCLNVALEGYTAGKIACSYPFNTLKGFLEIG